MTRIKYFRRMVDPSFSGFVQAGRRSGALLLGLFLLLAPHPALSDCADELLWQGEARATPSGFGVDEHPAHPHSEIPLPKRADFPALPGWGYSFDSLRADLDRWAGSPFVRIDTLGLSVLGRPLFRVHLHDSSGAAQPGEAGSGPVPVEVLKPHIVVHARTHPREVQSSWILREMVRFLLDTSSQAAALRREFVFDFVPMLNPDGVDSLWRRTNADNVDLEGNWRDPLRMEPEAAALRAFFLRLLAEGRPVKAALNLHADSLNCTRFFISHNAAGTSPLFERLQEAFIEGVRRRFPGGIKPWRFVHTWSGGTGVQYPEGFWWTQKKESVMALTFEDSYCGNASAYDSTATALLLGTADYIRNPPPNGIRGRPASGRGPGLIAFLEGGRIRVRSAGSGESGGVEGSGAGKMAPAGPFHLRLSDARGRLLVQGSFTGLPAEIPLRGALGAGPLFLHWQGRGAENAGRALVFAGGPP